MDEPANSAENVFAEAIEMPRGPKRSQWLDLHCAGNLDLRREVDSLLDAFDRAGNFLGNHEVVSKEVSVPTATGSQVHAAVLAGTFVQGVDAADSSAIELYVGKFPANIRDEVRERIKACLHVRQLRGDKTAATKRAGELPPSLPGYEICRKVGEGSLGVVYEAQEEKLNRRVAIKVLHRGSDEAVRGRLLKEARNAAALRDPAVVTIYSVLDETEPPAIVMEMVDGFPIDQFASQLNFEQKARLLREVARGLSVAHASGLIHRDLKPENVIVGPDMRPRILDFGLSLSLEEAGRLGRSFEGTPLYASPEQVQGRPLTAASDVFSLGSLMFKVLAGRTPFAGKTTGSTLEAIATTAPPFLRDVAVGVPEDLQAICLSCLAWNPADRPTAQEVALELGHFLVGEPVRLKPKLYDDLLRRSISEYSNQAREWESQCIITHEERDSLEVVHRRLLADEDNWLIDARRITFLQTILSGGTWLAVVASVLMVWLLREELGEPWKWVLPGLFALALLIAGNMARKQHEMLGAATFLAGAALAIAPSMLALLAEAGIFAEAPTGVTQLFDKDFTNQQVLVASLASFGVSAFGLWRLKMTGFAWTSAAMATASYISFLLLFNWLEKKPEIQALWCLPLVGMEGIALWLEKKGRVRWTMPFHLIASLTLVAGLDVMAFYGPTLSLLGITEAGWPYFDHCRQVSLSVVANGMCFLGLTFLSERSFSLDLRRMAKWLEMLAMVHVLSALYVNAWNHHNADFLRVDVALYIAAAVLFSVLAPFRSRWRMLVGGLIGCGLGSYLLVSLGLVAKKTFIVSLGIAGICLAFGAFLFVRLKSTSNAGANRKIQK